MSGMSVGSVREYIANQTIEVEAQSGKGFHRVLTFTVGGALYEVLDHGDVVYRGVDTQKAIDAYDEILPR